MVIHCQQISSRLSCFLLVPNLLSWFPLIQLRIKFQWSGNQSVKLSSPQFNIIYYSLINLKLRAVSVSFTVQEMYMWMFSLLTYTFHGISPILWLCILIHSVIDHPIQISATQCKFNSHPNRQILTALRQVLRALPSLPLLRVRRKI